MALDLSHRTAANRRMKKMLGENALRVSVGFGYGGSAFKIWATGPTSVPRLQTQERRGRRTEATELLDDNDGGTSYYFHSSLMQ